MPGRDTPWYAAGMAKLPGILSWLSGKEVAALEKMAEDVGSLQSSFEGFRAAAIHAQRAMVWADSFAGIPEAGQSQAVTPKWRRDIGT